MAAWATKRHFVGLRRTPRVRSWRQAVAGWKRSCVTRGERSQLVEMLVGGDEMPGAVVDRHSRFWDVSGQPRAVRGRYEHVADAVPDLDRHVEVLDVESPRRDECQIVVHPAPTPCPSACGNDAPQTRRGPGPVARPGPRAPVRSRSTARLGLRRREGQPPRRGLQQVSYLVVGHHSPIPTTTLFSVLTARAPARQRLEPVGQLGQATAAIRCHPAAARAQVAPTVHACGQVVSP